VHRTVRCTTGQSLLLSGARLLSKTGTVDRCSFGPVGHRTLSGAHRTVWCPLPTVGVGHASPADCTADRCASDRWLTGQSGAPLGSPVNYSRTPLNFSRERPFHRRPAWRTGHCPVCQTELSFGCTEPSLFDLFSSFFLTVSST
jgi:hypothetical protein